MTTPEPVMNRPGPECERPRQVQGHRLALEFVPGTMLVRPHRTGTCRCGWVHKSRHVGRVRKAYTRHLDREWLKRQHEAPDVDNSPLQWAVEAARRSPCAKSKRGVVIWEPGASSLSSWGYNAPPRSMRCDGSLECRSACNMVCVHAEARALLMLRSSTMGLHMLHVKVIDGQPVPSGGPSCWQCSRLILAAGIETMWLLHDDGLQAYSALDFHRLTLEHHSLPVLEREQPKESNS